jgi:polar amino acid transport system substrate-binding protein
MKIILSLAIIILLSPTDSFAKNILYLGQPVDPIAEISARVLVDAYERINFEIDFKKLPAERSLVNSNNGLLDGEVNRVMGIDKKYSNLIRIPIPINSFEGVVFTKKHHFTVRGWDCLKPYTIAIRVGAKFAENGTRGMKVSKFSTYEKVFMLVAKDRYDICISSRITGFYQIKKQDLLGLKPLEPPIAEFKLYHYLHKKHKDLVPKISDSLLKMQQEGTILKTRELFINELLQPNVKFE